MKKQKPTKGASPEAKAGAEESADRASGRSANKVWSGMLSFGLISMPVCLFTAATEERVSFNQLHPSCNGRIKQQLFCPNCNKVVAKADLVKGYEYEKDRYVIISEDELTAVEPKSGKTLELSAFVPATQVDPIFFESSYYLAPLEGGHKPYALVLQAMRESNLVAITRIVRNRKEHICVIRPYGQGMILQNLYWTDEIRTLSCPELPATNEAEVAVAKQLIQMLTTDWDPKQYTDAYRAAVMQLIASKSEGKELPSAVPTTQKAEVIDITSALQQSLAAAKARKGIA
jgi:DNA end-binding protein Ku